MRLTENQLRVLFKTQGSAVVHGPSGHGKTAMAKSYADRFGMRLLMMPTPNIDPMALSIPHKEEKTFDGGEHHRIITMFIADWISDLCAPSGPDTLLLLDEYNRPMHPHTMNIFTQLLEQRSLYGYKLRENVQI